MSNHASLRSAATAILTLCLTAAIAPTPARATSAVRLLDLPKHWRDDDGREFPLTQLAGQRVILTMAYTSCHDLCPATIALLQDVQRELDSRGEQAQIIVVGYDPANDDPATWHQYRINRHLLRHNWHFLSGSAGDTQQLAHDLGFDFWKYDEHVMHQSRMVVFSAEGNQKAWFGPKTANWAAKL